MPKQCEECKKILGLREKKSINYFIDEQEKGIVLCTNCYFDLSKNEKKKLIHTGKKFSGGKYKPQGLVFGVVGSVGYSAGQNSGAHWMLNKRMKKKGFTQKKVDEMSIDMFNTHWDFIDVASKQELLKRI